jgi:hypothetical protein
MLSRHQDIAMALDAIEALPGSAGKDVMRFIDVVPNVFHLAGSDSEEYAPDTISFGIRENTAKALVALSEALAGKKLRVAIELDAVQVGGLFVLASASTDSERVFTYLTAKDSTQKSLDAITTLFSVPGESGETSRTELSGFNKIWITSESFLLGCYSSTNDDGHASASLDLAEMRAFAGE